MDMQIESNRSIGLERRLKLGRRPKGQIIDIALKFPLRMLALVPFILEPARREAASISITRMDMPLEGLPPAFDGLKIAFLTDLHSGPTTSREFLSRVVKETNANHPDVILLGGDYITREVGYLSEVAAVLARLHAPLGIYGVLGNHDYWQDPEAVHNMLQEAGIEDISNSGRWLHCDGSRLRIAGVDDMWEGEPDLRAALAGMKDRDIAILLSHNPDFAVKLHDPHVKLVLSGHTHGGQICLPGIGPLVTNSRYGRRVVSGLVPLDGFQLYTSRGLGTVLASVRYNCPPEIAFFTLRAK